MNTHAAQREHQPGAPPGHAPSGYVSPMSVKPVHFALADHGRVLATRNAGRKVAAHLAELIEGQPSIVLNFHDVEAVTPPFLDELLRVVRAELAAKREGRVIVVTNLDDDVRETLQLLLDRHRLSLAELRGGRVELLTSVPYLAETLQAAQDLGTEYFTAPQLAERLALKLPNANQRLGQLVQAGAIARERDPDAERGKRYRYSAPQADTLIPA
jgi:hypothetical protein